MTAVNYHAVDGDALPLDQQHEQGDPWDAAEAMRVGAANRRARYARLEAGDPEEVQRVERGRELAQTYLAAARGRTLTADEHADIAREHRREQRAGIGVTFPDRTPQEIREDQRDAEYAAHQVGREIR